MATWKECTLGAVRDFLAGGDLNLPEGAHQVWEFFVDLHHTRGNGFSGAEPIRYAEIEAYARLMQLPFEPQHVSMIRAIDRTWMEHASRQEGTSGTQDASRNVQPVSPAAFDAVFGS